MNVKNITLFRKKYGLTYTISDSKITKKLSIMSVFSLQKKFMSFYVGEAVLKEVSNIIENTCNIPKGELHRSIEEKRENFSSLNMREISIILSDIIYKKLIYQPRWQNLLDNLAKELTSVKYGEMYLLAVSYVIFRHLPRANIQEKFKSLFNLADILPAHYILRDYLYENFDGATQIIKEYLQAETKHKISILSSIMPKLVWPIKLEDKHYKLIELFKDDNDPIVKKMLIKFLREVLTHNPKLAYYFILFFSNNKKHDIILSLEKYLVKSGYLPILAFFNYKNVNYEIIRFNVRNITNSGTDICIGDEVQISCILNFFSKHTVLIEFEMFFLKSKKQSQNNYSAKKFFIYHGKVLAKEYVFTMKKILKFSNEARFHPGVQKCYLYINGIRNSTSVSCLLKSKTEERLAVSTSTQENSNIFI